MSALLSSLAKGNRLEKIKLTYVEYLQLKEENDELSEEFMQHMAENYQDDFEDEVKIQKTQNEIKEQEDLEAHINDDKYEEYKEKQQMKKDDMEDLLEGLDGAKDEREVKRVKIEKIVKQLYRKISIKTHPDKVQDETKNELFKEAKQAKETNDIVQLVVIASIVKVKLDNVFKNPTVNLEIDRQLEVITIKADTMRKQYHWKWKMSDDDHRGEVEEEFWQKSKKSRCPS
jgi:hypothetical protein